jgi:ammonium transporter, Amt family
MATAKKADETKKVTKATPAAVAAWTAVTITIVFLIIKKTMGLRVSEEEEIKGLDPTEHGLPTAYADFLTTK